MTSSISLVAVVIAAILALSAVTTTMTSPVIAAAAVVNEEVKKKICLVASSDTQVKLGGTLGEKLETRHPEEDADQRDNDVFAVMIHTGQTLCLQTDAEFTVDEERGEIVLQTAGEVHVLVDAEIKFSEYLEAVARLPVKLMWSRADE